MVKNPTFSSKLLFLVFIAGFIALWNIPNTIAGRYLLSACVLIVVLYHKPNWTIFFKKNKFLLLFFLYLFIHLLFLSTDFHQALRAFRGEWLKLILYVFIGAGIGLLISRQATERILLFFGWAFSIPNLLYLFLLAHEIITKHTIPWGYTGLSISHGDLGYAAFGASLLLSPLAIHGNSQKTRLFAYLGLAINLAAVLFAQSRGGLIFALLPIAIILGLEFFYKIRSRHFLIAGVTLLAGLLLGVGVVQFSELNANSKWSGMVERAKFGFIGNDPLKINCEGRGVIEKILQEKGVSLSPEVQTLIAATIDGDGARVLAARGAIKLVLLNPWGLDESKDSYQKALINYCQAPPKIMLSNAHNGWLNMALAIGIPGAILYLLVMINFEKQAYQRLRIDSSSLPALSLLLATSLWIIRSLLDATLQDQMLEMQVFVMAFLSSLLIKNEEPKHV